MLLLGEVTSTCDQEYRTVGSNFLHLCQFLVCSGKSQLSNYVNAHCLQISIWTWFMSYHVETTLCHDITTYDISWQPYTMVTLLFLIVLMRLCLNNTCTYSSLIARIYEGHGAMRTNNVLEELPPTFWRSYLIAF